MSLFLLLLSKLFNNWSTYWLILLYCDELTPWVKLAAHRSHSSVSMKSLHQHVIRVPHESTLRLMRNNAVVFLVVDHWTSSSSSQWSSRLHGSFLRGRRRHTTVSFDPGASGSLLWDISNHAFHAALPRLGHGGSSLKGDIQTSLSVASSSGWTGWMLGGWNHGLLLT